MSPITRFHITLHFSGFLKRTCPIYLTVIFLELNCGAMCFFRANLSTDYFTNRQDRYVLLRNANLADFYVDLINLVARLSFRLAPSGAVTFDIRSLLGRWNDKQRNAVTHKYDTVVYPLVQFGAAGLHDGNQAIIQFIRDTDQSDQYDLYLASGYFNPTRAYADALLDTCKHCRVLLASRESNGFYGAKGFSRQVPHIYLSYVNVFLNEIVRRDQQHRILLNEYARDGWTFHAKGIWLRGTKPDGRYYTIIGSSNLGNCIYTNAVVTYFTEAQPSVINQIAVPPLFTLLYRLDRRKHHLCADDRTVEFSELHVFLYVQWPCSLLMMLCSVSVLESLYLIFKDRN
ncbi:hypothetical protein TTRE_0000870601 [Trichuris trichiura]|uniref:CDP-diacylglycerol--glycerol-3-phosphate 3-phosphatidyltransferase n=1 Tax=Trichuris trichiura TaxID=36087 RepID=A0A077ZKV1_TRITR|nr:hypothetical protein TTRE_0000870601 [Trichuris trichiura]